MVNMEKITIITRYTPTDEVEEVDKDDFYDLISSDVVSIFP